MKSSWPGICPARETNCVSNLARTQALREVDIGLILSGTWVARYLGASLELSADCTPLDTSTASGRHADCFGKAFWQGIYPADAGCLAEDGDWTGECPGPQVPLKPLPCNVESLRNTFIV